jgi:asparagine N-glycosylation enzyme membrane subunit Stt3
MDREYTNEELEVAEATEEVEATEEMEVEVYEEKDETDAAMESFLSGSNDFQVEPEEAPEVKEGKKHILIAALSVMALAIFSISVYGSAVIAAIAIALALVIKPEKFVTQTVVANSLALGVCIVIKAILTVIPAIATPLMAFVGAGNNAFANLSGVLTIFGYLLVVLSFIFFVVNAFALMSKKTALFGKTAEKLC